jgi:1,4-alpha-glucan branching enzyme
MGNEFAQLREWNHDQSLDWHLLSDPRHAQIQLLVGELNRLHSSHAALHALDHDPAGFRWVDANDSEQSVATFMRFSRTGRPLLCAFNFTPIPRTNYRVGVDHDTDWIELFNTDSTAFGGSGWGNEGRVTASVVPAHNRRFSLSLTLPPLAAVFLEPLNGAHSHANANATGYAFASESADDPTPTPTPTPTPIPTPVLP